MYCLIGKIVVWGVLPLIASAVAGIVYLVAIYKARRNEHPLRKLFVSKLFVEGVYQEIFDLFDPMEFHKPPRGPMGDALVAIIAAIASPILAPLGFIELVVHWCIRRFRHTAAGTLAV